MRKVGLFEAKQKLSELVKRAASGEHIGITRRGKLAVVLGPAPAEKGDVAEMFKRIEQVRRRARKVPGLTAKKLIEEGRM